MFDDTKIDIPCPDCGRESKQTIRRLKTNPELSCSCGARFHVKADQLRRTLKKIEDSLKRLGR